MTWLNPKRVAVVALLVAGPLTRSAASQAGPQETEIPGVTARLAYARLTNGVVRVGILLKNDTTAAIRGKGISYSNVVLIDAKSNQKHFALKDSEGHYLAGPMSDFGGGGRWFGHFEAGADTLMWFMFDAVPPGTKVSIQVPTLQPFDDVEIKEAAPSPKDDPGTSAPPVRISLVSANRASGQLKVRLKLVSDSKRPPAQGCSILYKNVHAFEPQSKKLYSLLKDSEGTYLAEPTSDKSEGGRYFLIRTVQSGQAFMSLTFEAPPDTVKQVDVLVPCFGPVEAVPIAGEGGATSSGTSVAGKSLDLQGALKDLNAEVTDRRIKVNLAADLLFDFDKAEIKPDAEPSLAKVVTVLKATPGATVTVEGHTDGKGADAYNQSLSEKRAVTVAQWLTSHAGLPAGTVHTKGWGKTKPVAPNTKPDGTDDPDGRAKNRRVEITVDRP